MSLIIKGMEMPKNGEHTTITVYGDGVWCVHRDNEPHGNVIPIPEKHGKIIDGDAIWQNMTEEQADAFEKGLAGTIELFEMLETAHAIIEAEGGGDDV